jgi:hypothetical protein
MLVAEQRFAMANASLNALAGDRLEVVGFLRLRTALRGAVQDRRGEGMLAAGLERGGKAQHLA